MYLNGDNHLQNVYIQSEITFTAPLALPCKTEFPTVYPTIYLLKWKFWIQLSLKWHNINIWRKKFVIHVSTTSDIYYWPITHWHGLTLSLASFKTCIIFCVTPHKSRLIPFSVKVHAIDMIPIDHSIPFKMISIQFCQNNFLIGLQWEKTWLSCDANNKGADQLVHPQSDKSLCHSLLPAI